MFYVKDDTIVKFCLKCRLLMKCLIINDGGFRFKK
nr:MAG TPA: hypothetical protein [Caudoviricetes sp.]